MNSPLPKQFVAEIHNTIASKKIAVKHNPEKEDTCSEEKPRGATRAYCPLCHFLPIVCMANPRNLGHELLEDQPMPGCEHCLLKTG